MKRFRFSLQAVLTIRADEERKALEAFALAQSVLTEAESVQRSIQLDIDELYAAQRDGFKRHTFSEGLQQMQQGLRALRDRLTQAAAEVKKAKAVSDEKSLKLLDARKKREVVDKLYEKRQARHHAGAARMEQRVLDDFATLKSVGGLALKWQ